ncbi:hypothetical protein B296_00035401 [Ensete ventricosum]|uniref:Lipoxygenase n=1 Tax=Ensete ventricosum TaxID=4639 RepID=A0A426ZHW6_ENSVE|nr:hypothetical protein B296_00035401 [Ensete ventricosum]
MLHGLLDAITGKHHEATKSSATVRGSVMLMKKNVLDFNDFNASLLDGLHEFLGKGVSLQLVSATVADPHDENKGKIGPPAYLEEWVTTVTSVATGETKFNVHFSWDESQGVPGAIIVKNNHHSEFYVKTITLEGVPNKERIHFVCNSWVYPVDKYKYDRIFFANDVRITYPILHTKTPELLKRYREEELVHLRGDDVTGELKEHDRVYNYAYYNDLGNPDKGQDYARPILGGSQEHPYPRRGRTGRHPTKTDPNYESRLSLLSLDIYVPRDERFGHLKMSDFLAYALKSLTQSLLPTLTAIFDTTPMEFDSFKDVLQLYEGGLPIPQSPELDEIRSHLPFEMLKELVRTDGERVLKLPLPQVIKGSRHSLAHELTLENKLFILDHHDALMPYLRRINSGSNKIYASRTLLLLKDDGTLKPLVIELSLPHPDGDQHGAVNRVFTPAEQGVEGSVWQLAKAYACVNDSGYHQLVSHWLNTHAVIEPFVIATNRQLSVVHPVYKLLSPHYRDTMNINALARQTLINAGGVLESTVFPGKYAMEMSSVVYRSWKLTEQGLPDDLLKRPNKLRLLIKDYPFAVDGLAIWSAIETWVTEYCSIYYNDDAAIRADVELQAWWKEVREVGHGDKKDEDWWPKMQTLAELTKTCTTIIWVASALHAAVNFGQYPYAGYLPNRPTISRRFMPEPGTPEYHELEKNPDLVFLKTITSQLQTILGVSLIEVLSRHSSDEVYLGQRDSPEWTTDRSALEAFERFSHKLIEIENRIISMNQDASLRNRTGPVKMPYTLLYPNTSDFTGVGGLTGRGIPNSVSI